MIELTIDEGMTVIRRMYVLKRILSEAVTAMKKRRGR